MAQIEENTNVVGYVGARINSRQLRRYLANAKTPAERSAIKSLVLSAPLKYVPVPKKTSDRTAEISEAIKNREAVALRG